MAHAPKPTALTLIPVFPSSRYCIALDSKSLLRFECDVDDTRVMVVHRAGDVVDDEASCTGETEREPARRIVVAVAEAGDEAADREADGGNEVEPVGAVDAALELDLLRFHTAFFDGDMPAVRFPRNRESGRRRALRGDVARAPDGRVRAGGTRSTTITSLRPRVMLAQD